VNGYDAHETVAICSVQKMLSQFKQSNIC